MWGTMTVPLDLCGCRPEGEQTVNIAGFFVLFMVDSKIFLNYRTECQLFILLVCLHASLHPGIANASSTWCQIYIKIFLPARWGACYPHCCSRVQLKCDGTRWRTGGEKWRGNERMEWIVSKRHMTAEHRLARAVQTLQADVHSSPASSRLNWRPCRFKWTRPFCRKTKSGFCACAITFQTQSTTLQNVTSHKTVTW